MDAADVIRNSEKMLRATRAVHNRTLSDAKVVDMRTRLLCKAFWKIRKIKEIRVWRNCDTRSHNGTLLSQCFFLFLLPPPVVSVLWRTCVYIHTSDCVQTVYELPLPPNNTAVKHPYTNQERCEVLTGYLSLGRQSGGDWANTWHWTERFTVLFWNRKQQQPQLLPHFVTYRIPRGDHYYKCN